MMDKIITTLILVLTLGYSLIRYNFFGDVPISDIPIYILNKAISFSIIIIFLVIQYSNIKKQDNRSNHYISTQRILLIIHILISISIFSQSYYAKFFDGERLSLNGNLALISGILAAAYVFNGNFRINSVMLYLLVAIHVFFIGYQNWLTPYKWNGYMPPITLICFIILTVLIILKLISIKKF